MDKYGTENDPLCYPESNVLINLLDITDQSALDIAEIDITNISILEINFNPPPYNLSYLSNIHKSLFSDIYSWAGELRTLDISKGTTRFCNVQFIEREAAKLFNKLAGDGYLEDLDRFDLVKAVAEYYGDINMLHPFREGNGRTQRILFEHIITNASFEISWETTNRDEWIEANIAAVNCDYKPLEAIFEKCIGDEIGEENV